jgi:tRNA C32,U32 (ribose-2'-O)-methylase TrmJ
LNHTTYYHSFCVCTIVRYFIVFFCSKVLSAEVDSVKQKQSTCEAECAAKCKQKHTVYAEIEDLLKQKHEFEDKLKDISRKLEDARTKHEFSMQDVANLKMMLEKIRYV